MNNSTRHARFHPSSRWALFVALDATVLQAVDAAGRANARDNRAGHQPLSHQERERALKTYARACALRTIGYYAGSLAVVLAFLAFCASVVAGILGMLDDLSEPVGLWVGVVFGALVFGGAALYWLTPLVVPATRISRHVVELEGASRPGNSGLKRFSTISIIRTSGKVARSVFRILTQKTVNIGARPDFADDVAHICESVMIRKPSSSGASYRGMEPSLNEHVVFLREVVALVVLDRLDLLDQLRTQKRREMLLEPEAAESAAIREYLQPFHGESILRVVRQDVLPLLSIAIALIAVLLTIVLPKT
ncbi:hypothetical protein [Microbacterium gorillae]|uniref:hypothetical protein n=1 Tax=Microbacterium gorillae TaxID=1231063 RepID=UPI003D95F3DF